MTAKTIGIIGGGQLGMMLGAAAQKLGHSCIFVNPDAQCSATPFGKVIAKNFDDASFVEELAKSCDLVTYEFENVDLELLKDLESKLPVYPNVDFLGVCQDRLTEKSMLEKHAISVADHREVYNLEDAKNAQAALGFPMILKTRRFGYDGKGQYFLQKSEDFAEVFAKESRRVLIAEKVIPFDFEVSKIASRSTNGDIVYYPLTKNAHREGILRLSTAPLQHSEYETLDRKANEAMARLMMSCDYVGTLAIEFFVVGDQLIANEVAPRVHNSGHWTMDAGIPSQFENHVRAITGMELGKQTTPELQVAMINIIGDAIPSHLKNTSDVFIHDYAKSPRPGRKLAHINVTAQDHISLMAKINQVTTQLQEAST